MVLKRRLSHFLGGGLGRWGDESAAEIKCVVMVERLCEVVQMVQMGPMGLMGLM